MSSADKVNQWLTLGANLGVLVGLILLLVGLDQNSDLLRAQIHQARADNFESFMVEYADTEQLLPAMVKFRTTGAPRDVSALNRLDPIERDGIRSFFDGRVAGYDNLYYQYRSGFLDEDFYSVRVVNSVRTWGPVWLELGLIRPGAENPRVTNSFAAEFERIMSAQ